MRKSDKLKNIKKVNVILEQRHNANRSITIKEDNFLKPKNDFVIGKKYKAIGNSGLSDGIAVEGIYSGFINGSPVLKNKRGIPMTVNHETMELINEF